LAGSTRRNYQTTFSNFLTYINEVGRDMSTVTLVDVLSFLQQLVDKKRAQSTIRAAHAALLHFFILHQRESVVSSPLVNLFVKGAQNLAPVKDRAPFIWDPEIPLAFLEGKPFPTLFRPAGKEALLLLLLATGIRVSDAHRLSRKMTKSGEVWVIPYLEHRKTGPSPPQLVRAYSKARLCPARALQRYLALAQTIRKDGERFLFISSRGTRADIDTLRGWIIELLDAAGIKAPAGSCRSASTSAAVARNMEVDQVLKAAGWAKESTFCRYYQRGIHPLMDCESLLPPRE
jgi:site-specific recombinase XerD